MIGFIIRTTFALNNYVKYLNLVFYVCIGLFLVSIWNKPQIKQVETSFEYCVNLESNLVYNLTHLANLRKKLTDNPTDDQLLASQQFYINNSQQIVNRAFLSNCSKIISYVNDK